jgi:hypothetical protein
MLRPLLVIGLFLSTSAFADTFLTVALGSYHFERGEFCEFNPGLGIEHGGETLRMIAGAFRNSLCDSSFYAGVSYAPLKYGRYRFGVAGAAFTGYLDRPVLALLPVAAYEARRWGVNLILIPPQDLFSGAMALQLKWPLR